MTSRSDRDEERARTWLGVVIASTSVGLLIAGGCVEILVPDPAVRYVAFGDSSTTGDAARDYPEILAELLAVDSAEFVNAGKSGENTEDGLERLQMLFSNEIYPNAEVLLYWEGGNDVTDFIKDHDRLLLTSPDDPDYPFADALEEKLDETQSNIESAVAAARQRGLEVLVATYFFIREDLGQCEALPFDVVLPFQAEAANAYLNLLNERVAAAAAGSGAQLVDVAASDEALRADVENYHDCNHLSAAGNAIVAQLFADALAADR